MGSYDKPNDLTAFGKIFAPEEAAQPILADAVRAASLEWLTEIWAKEELSAVGLKARRKALFTGPPGVGKTTLAHHFAARLGLRMIAVRPESIIDSWVGANARNLGTLFNAVEAEAEPVVIFFDEFDSLGGKRIQVRQGADTQHNEMINTLLQRLEQHDGFVIAATNFADALDSAVWRRFDFHISLDLPGAKERRHILARYFKPYVLPRAALDALADSFETATPALIRQFVEAMKRNVVIGPKCNWDMRKERVVERILAAVTPHPDLGKPRLWSHGAKDAGIRALPWPLSTERADEAEQADDGAEEREARVVPFGKHT